MIVYHSSKRFLCCVIKKNLIDKFMSHTSKIFNKIPIDIPNRSGFDMSFENLLTLPCGTLVPVLCEEVIPNETYNIGHLSQITLPPLATNSFGRIDLRFEAFFVPNRIVWQGWQNFWTMPANNPYGTEVVRPTSVPTFKVSSTDTEFQSYFNRGTLADYLGYKIPKGSSRPTLEGSLMPFLAYQKIYDDWYRNSKIQKPVFINNSNPLKQALFSPWNPSGFIVGRLSDSELNDKLYPFSLRQRNWAKDYFTTASLYPQASGDVVGASVELNTTNDSTQLSISALRSANVLQRWLDRNNVAGERYADQIKAQYGVLPSDALLDRPLLLGGDTVGVYNRSVYSTSQTGTSDKNPFTGNVGSAGASAQGFKDGNLVDNFKATEHGYIMILASLVPHAYYSTGVRRQLSHIHIGDFAIPLLQGLGMQDIRTKELAYVLGSTETIFGYQQQYSEYKYHDDEVHGLLTDGELLSSFALQRSFVDAPVLGTEFLQIPKNYLDQITVASSDLGSVAWLDCYISMKKISPLSEYVIPTLGDLKNTHKENIPLGGRQL